MQNLALLADVALNESSYRKNLELSKKKMDYSNCPDLQILADAAVKKIEKALTTTTIPRTKKITLPVIMLDEGKHKLPSTWPKNFRKDISHHVTSCKNFHRSSKDRHIYLTPKIKLINMPVHIKKV